MATSSGEVASLSPEEAVQLALGGDADPGSDIDRTFSQEEVEIELLHPEELQHIIHYRLPQKIASLVFHRETEEEDEVAVVIRRRYQKRFKQSYDKVDPSEAFRRLKQSANNTVLNWESQLEECVAGEGDEFWTAVAQKTQQDSLKRSDAILEVYTDRFVENCRGSEDLALICILRQDLTEFSTTLFVNKLLERGASPSFTLSDLDTALHLAAAKGHTAVAHSLVEYNAIVDAKNKLNKTPLEIAIKTCKNDFATFLVKSMRPGRVRQLFESSANDEESRLSLHDMLRQKRTVKTMQETILAILDCMKERVEGEREVYLVHYRILDSDHHGRAPDSKRFNNSHKSCLQKIAKSGNKEIVYHDVVRLLLRRKWKKFARYHFMMQCLAFLVFYGILNVALVLAANSPDPRVYSSPADYVRGVCEAVALLNTFWCLLAEVIRMYKHRLGYLQDPVNYLDLASIFSPLLVIPFRVTNLDAQWVFASVSFLFVGLKMFKYVTAFRATGAFVRILFRVVLIDVVQFSILFVILLYAFSGALYLALRGERLSPTEQATVQTDSNSSTVPGTPTSLDISPLETSQLYYVWLLGIRVMIQAGDVLRTGYYYSGLEGTVGFKWLGVLLYLVFLFIVVVILLNMLIAAMADTYSNVQSDAQRDLALARAWIVARIEHNSMLRIDYRRRTYVPIDFVENPQELLEKWELPPINAVTRKLERVNRAMKKQADELEKSKHDIMEAINQQQKVLLTLEKSVRELKDGLQHSIHTDRGISKRGAGEFQPPQLISVQLF